ncbi:MULTISPECIES: Bax inhibitor-1/YccA family protein [Trueperella]|uniref:Bax inhibitor-1/YccA family protein n=1 Tax=Trueperella TaxID=1069494 RepID=UPI0022EB88B1|nr:MULTISPECIES: Bax inhibitor-1/YccA family protein [Trueperella]MCI7306369.1 Bax inhibitor-1/YccA family protein [Trueperella sp.]MDY5403899.1 Bax inhibitor-1/YccA family protein [Trueperella sp.]
MSNPITTRNPYFSTQQARPNQFDQTQFGDQYGYGQTEYGDQYAAYAQPGADVAGPGAFATERMTYKDALNKVGLLLGIALVSGVATAILLPPDAWMPAAMVSVLGAFVVGMVLAFQRMVKPGLAIAYAVLEGVALGAMTAALDLFIPGIAIQTILATAIIVGVTLALHYSGTVRTTPKGRKIVITVALGYLIFSLVNLVLMWTGVLDQAWGARGYEVAGIPLGVLLGAGMILIASYMLIGDFEDINTAIVNGAPREFSWTVGIAIVMTILWIYVEVLRIIAILSDR